MERMQEKVINVFEKVIYYLISPLPYIALLVNSSRGSENPFIPELNACKRVRCLRFKLVHQ